MCVCVSRESREEALKLLPVSPLGVVIGTFYLLPAVGSGTDSVSGCYLSSHVGEKGGLVGTFYGTWFDVECFEKCWKMNLVLVVYFQ